MTTGFSLLWSGIRDLNLEQSNCYLSHMLENVHLLCLVTFGDCAIDNEIMNSIFYLFFFFYFSRGTESFNQPLDIGLELWLWELGFVLSPALSLTHNECTEVTVGMNGSVHYFIRQQNNTTASHLNSFFMQNHKSPNFRYGTGMSQDDPVCQHK